MDMDEGDERMNEDKTERSKQMGSLNPMTSRPVIASPKSAHLQDSLRSLLVEDAGLRDKLMPAFSDELLRHMRGEKQECGSTYFAWRAVCV